VQAAVDTYEAGRNSAESGLVEMVVLRVGVQFRAENVPPNLRTFSERGIRDAV